MGASQDANRATFEQANDALDPFCRDTGFRYGVFIEHAIGRGEATRQRFARSGDASPTWARTSRTRPSTRPWTSSSGASSPRSMMLRAPRGHRQARRCCSRRSHAQGSRPERRRDAGGQRLPRGARSDATRAWSTCSGGYHRRGHRAAVHGGERPSVDDLRATAWNTYHAGFSTCTTRAARGCVPPSRCRARARLGRPLLAAWSECAQRAGYVRADLYCATNPHHLPLPAEGRVQPGDQRESLLRAGRAYRSGFG